MSSAKPEAAPDGRELVRTGSKRLFRGAPKGCEIRGARAVERARFAALLPYVAE